MVLLYDDETYLKGFLHLPHCVIGLEVEVRPPAGQGLDEYLHLATTLGTTLGINTKSL